MQTVDEEQDNPVSREHHTSPAPANDEPTEPLREEKQSQDTLAQPAPPTQGMDMRGVRRRRGGPFANEQPAMPAPSKDDQIHPGEEQQSSQDIPGQTAMPDHSHD
jgi:hypothetical protein